MIDVNNFTDEEISWRGNDFFNQLKRTNKSLTRREFIDGVRNGTFDLEGFFKERQQRSHLKHIPIDRFPDPQEKQTIQSVECSSQILVECPYCHSTNTKKISGSSRFFSVGIFGPASGKLGKQWHCKRCGSDF